MAYAQVAAGTVVESTNGGTPGALSFGQPPTLNNLLLCFVAVGGSTTFPTTPSGWAGTGFVGTSCIGGFFQKIAVGGDAPPSFASIASATQAFLLAEFSGGVFPGPQDRSIGGAFTTSPTTTTMTNPDTAGSGDLLAYSLTAWYSAAATKANSVSSLNNGAVPVDITNNNGVSDTLHYNFGYGITTSNSVADSGTATIDVTSIIGCVNRMVSYKVGFEVAGPRPNRMPLGA